MSRLELVSIYPCLPRTERGRPLVMGLDPKGETFLYTNGNHVIIRNCKNFEDNDMYSQHSVQVSVAKYSPNGSYIASGDLSGKVRIWDTINKEHILKAEYQPLGGPIADISWGEDSKRLVIGGSGRDKFVITLNGYYKNRFASAILVDTGSTTGELMGMGRPINSIDIKQSRPYKVITGSEDNLVCFFDGPPFKFSTSSTLHTNFVNSVRYSPSGNIFISAGADGKIFSYDGKTGQLLAEVGPNAHNAGIYAVEFSPNGRFFVSVSADKSMKFWHVQDTLISMIGVYQLENSVQNSLLSVTWSGETIIACALNGALYMFNETDILSGSISGPKNVIYGHSKPITCSSYNREQNLFVTASMDATMAVWPRTNTPGKVEPGNCWMMSMNESAHKNQVQSLVSCGDFVASVGIDDRLVIASLHQKQFVGSTKLDSQPRSIGYSCVNQLIAVATLKFLYVFSLSSAETAAQDLARGPLAKITVQNDPETIAINHKGTIIVLGHDDGSLSFYQVSQAQTDSIQINLRSDINLKLKGKVTQLAFSPDGTHLASSDADRTVSAFSINNEDGSFTVASVTQDWWRFHNARVNCIAWHPNSRKLASGSLDCSIIIWDLDNIRNRIHQTNAHPISQITSLAWESDNILLSTGQDACIKRWKTADN